MTLKNEKPIYIVLVGCGQMSKTWINCSLKIPMIKIIALIDINLAQAQAHQIEFSLHDAIIGTDLQKVLTQLAQQQTPADVVYDCSIPEAHYDVVMTALNHDCHILGEKPMAESMKQAETMTTLALKKKKTYAIIQNRRYDPNIIAYKDCVQSGAIGKLTTLNADFYIGAHFGGFRETMSHVLLLDMAIHSFDQARFISGADPISVQCYEFNPQDSWYRHGASAIALFEMSDGSIFSYRGSWCSEGLNTSWQCDWRAIGTKGSAKWDGEQQIIAQKAISDSGFFRVQQDIDIIKKELPYLAHEAIIQEFIDCLLHHKIPQTVCTDNIKSLAMVHAAIESAETNKKVMIHLNL